MSNRIQLSESTYIDDRYMVTSDIEVAAQIHAGSEMGGTAYIGGAWLIPDWYDWGEASMWRIHVTELPAIYGYREGEPWCVAISGTRGGYIGPLFIEVHHEVRAECLVHDGMFHARAVIPCGGNADSLRKLWEVIQEVAK